MDAWGRKLYEKEIRIPIDIVTGVVFFLFGLVILLVMPDQVAISEKDVINGRAFPTLLMVLLLLCCAMLAGKELYKLATGLLFLGPQVAQLAAQLGTAEYFMVCVFGLTIIAGVSGKSMITFTCLWLSPAAPSGAGSRWRSW